MKYEVREIAESVAVTLQTVAVKGDDGKPKIDAEGREITKKEPVTLRSHSVLVVVEDSTGVRPVRVPLKLSDDDTLKTARAKADAAAKAALGL